ALKPRLLVNGIQNASREFGREPCIDEVSSSCSCLGPNHVPRNVGDVSPISAAQYRNEADTPIVRGRRVVASNSAVPESWCVRSSRGWALSRLLANNDMSHRPAEMPARSET